MGKLRKLLLAGARAASGIQALAPEPVLDRWTRRSGKTQKWGALECRREAGGPPDVPHVPTGESTSLLKTPVASGWVWTQPASLAQTESPATTRGGSAWLPPAGPLLTLFPLPRLPFQSLVLPSFPRCDHLPKYAVRLSHPQPQNAQPRGRCLFAEQTEFRICA